MASPAVSAQDALAAERCPACHFTCNNHLNLLKHIKLLHPGWGEGAARAEAASAPPGPAGARAGQKRHHADHEDQERVADASVHGHFDRAFCHFKAKRQQQLHEEHQQQQEQAEPAYSLEDACFMAIAQCNGGRGLSNTDIDRVLKVVNQARQEPSSMGPMVFTTAAGFNAYTDR